MHCIFCGASERITVHRPFAMLFFFFLNFSIFKHAHTEQKEKERKNDAVEHVTHRHLTIGSHSLLCFTIGIFCPHHIFVRLCVCGTKIKLYFNFLAYRIVCIEFYTSMDRIPACEATHTRTHTHNSIDFSFVLKFFGLDTWWIWKMNFPKHRLHTRSNA